MSHHGAQYARQRADAGQRAMHSSRSETKLASYAENEAQRMHVVLSGMALRRAIGMDDLQNSQHPNSGVSTLESMYSSLLRRSRVR